MELLTKIWAENEKILYHAVSYLSRIDTFSSITPSFPKDGARLTQTENLCTIVSNKGGNAMSFKDFFPVWDQLTGAQQEKLTMRTTKRTVTKGTVIHSSLDCTGLLLIEHGQLRAYILSDEGREITIYRLLDRDICLLSASCMMRSIQFEITIEAEKDTSLWIVPADCYQDVMKESAALANYTNEIMAARFSEVMWLMDQVMWKSFDKRLAGFLLEESALEGTFQLKMTHEAIANHLGTAREVVTRMLRYFQNGGMVKLSRGTVELIDIRQLSQLQDA